jgi:hypothetical protein
MGRFVIGALGAAVCVLSIASTASAKDALRDPRRGEPAATTTTAGTRDVKRAAQEADKAEEMPDERTHLSLAVTPLLPVGDLSNAFSFGLGGTLGVEHSVHPHVQIVGRSGYAMLFRKQGINASLSAIPIWGGARYTFGVGEGAYVEGLMGPSVIIASVAVRNVTINGVNTGGTASDSEVKFGMSFGGGYQKGRFDAGARVQFWDLGNAGNSTTLIASVGWSFAAF